MNAQRKGLPPKDLGGVFGTGRTSGLVGSLSPVTPSVGADALAEELAAEQVQDEEQTRTPEPAPRSEADPADAADDSGAKKATTPRPRRTRSAKKGADASAPEREPKHNYPVYVPSVLRAEFNERRGELGTENTLLYFDAIDALIDHDSADPYARLRGLVGESLVGPAPKSLFDRAPARKRAPQENLGAPTQLVLRVTQHNQTVLDSLVTETGAKDRSHLATVVLSAYLNQQGEKKR